MLRRGGHLHAKGEGVVTFILRGRGGGLYLAVLQYGADNLFRLTSKVQMFGVCGASCVI